MNKNEVTIENLASLVGGKVEGDGTLHISGFAPSESAGPGEITFLSTVKKAGQLSECKATAVLVPLGVEKVDNVTTVQVKDPYLAVAIIHSFFVAEPFKATGIHPRAHVGENCKIGKEISIGPLVVVGDDVQLGERVKIEPGVVIGDRVTIGDDVTLKANVTIYHESVIGSRVAIHSGTVVGSDGYGYSVNERGEHIKRPQVGIVQIDDDVEIGSNCCIDRAAYGVTWIKSGVKIDNLVQVAHNVVVGENSLLVAQVGLSGSTILGRNVVMGGQSATKGHIVLDDQVMVAGKSGVHNNQPKGARIGGSPAIPIRQWAKSCAVFAKLPELNSNVKINTKAIADLNDKANDEE